MKVLFETNIPSPYRVAFFEEFGKYVDLTVAYERRRAADREKDWGNDDGGGYRKIYMKGIKTGAEGALCFDILSVVKKNSFDYIIIDGYSSPTSIILNRYLKRKNIPFIISVDGGFAKNDRGLKYKIKKNLISAASCWLSSGKETDEYLCYYGARREHMFWYPFTSLKNEDLIKNIDKPDKEEKKKQLGISGEFIVIAVGSFIPRKGFDVLIRAAAKLKEQIKVYIIGSDPTPEYLELVRQNALNNVYFAGFQTKEELKKYYYIADLFVMPTRFDVWGLVVNEAMAAGLAVVTTKSCVAGLELVEDEKNGYIVQADDEMELADRINRIYIKQLSGSMGKESLNRIQPYTIENMAKIHFGILKKLEENK